MMKFGRHGRFKFCCCKKRPGSSPGRVIVRKKENKPNILSGIELILEGFYSISEAFCSFNMFPPPLPPLFTDEEIKAMRYEDGLEKDAQALRSDWEKILGPDLKGVKYEQQDDECSSQAPEESQEAPGTGSSRKEKSE